MASKRKPSATRSDSMKEWHRKRKEALSFLSTDTSHLQENPVAVNTPHKDIVVPYTERRVSYDRFLDITPEELSSVMSTVDTGRLDEVQDLFSVIMKDPKVLNATGLRKDALVSSPFQIEPASEDEDDVKAALLVKDIISDVDAFEGFLKRALDAVFRGVSVHKIDWYYENGTWRIRDFQMLHPRRFVWDENFNLRLWDRGAYGQDGLHLDPGLFVVHNPESFSTEYPHRQGLLFSIAAYVVFKKLGITYWLGGAEKFGFPMLIGEVTEKAPREIKENLREALENVSSYTAAVVEVGTNIKALDFQAPPVVIWDSLVAAFNKEISEVLVGARLVLDTSPDGGSWALGKEHKGAFLTKIRGDSVDLANTLRSQLFRPILERNKALFTKKPKPPKIKWVFNEDKIAHDVVLASLDKGLLDREEARKLLGFESSHLVKPSTAELQKAAEGQEAPSEQPADEAMQQKPAGIQIEVGSQWTDTTDGHRIEVTNLDENRVYCVDLDAENPNRQFSWSRSHFLEICRLPSNPNPVSIEGE
jgi:phage gp29-like protein